VFAGIATGAAIIALLLLWWCRCDHKCVASTECHYRDPLLFASFFVASGQSSDPKSKLVENYSNRFDDCHNSSTICNNGIELVSNTNVQPRSIARRHNNRLAGPVTASYLQQWHGIALEETTSNLAGSFCRHSCKRCLQ
jgi:hypothetical protein